VNKIFQHYHMSKIAVVLNISMAVFICRYKAAGNHSCAIIKVAMARKYRQIFSSVLWRTYKCKRSGKKCSFDKHYEVKTIGKMATNAQMNS